MGTYTGNPLLYNMNNDNGHFIKNDQYTQFVGAVKGEFNSEVTETLGANQHEEIIRCNLNNGDGGLVVEIRKSEGNKLETALVDRNGKATLVKSDARITPYRLSDQDVGNISRGLEAVYDHPNKDSATPFN
jgi:hypothetical protein